MVFFFKRIWALFVLVLLFHLEAQSQELSDSLKRTGRQYFRQKKFDQAISLQKKVIDIYEVKNDVKATSNALNDLGIYYYSKGDYDSSLIYYKKALELDHDLNDSRRLGSRYKNLGITYRKKGNYIEAINYYIKALEVFDKIGNIREKGSTQNSIATLLKAQGKPKESIAYLFAATNASKVTNDTLGYVSTINNIGNAYFSLNNYDSAQFFYRKALALKLQSNNERINVSSTLNNLGEAFLTQQILDSAHYYLNWSYNERLKEGDSRGIALTANNLAELALVKKAYSDAEHWLDQSRIRLKKTTSRNLWARHHLLRAQLYKATDRTDSAYHYLQAGRELEDTLFQTEKLAVLDQLNAYEKNVISAEKHQAEQEVQTQKLLNEQQRYLVIIALLLLAVAVTFLVFVFRSRRQLQQVNTQLDHQHREVTRLNDQLATLNEDIRHRKQNDYNRLLSVMDIMEDDQGEAIEVLSPLQSVVMAAYDIDEFLDQHTQQETVYLDGYLSELANRLNAAHDFERQSVSFDLSVDPLSFKAKTASTLAYIISELVNNTCKHAAGNSEHTKIQLSIMQKMPSGLVHFRYTDNGPEDEIVEKLKQGSGLGWSLLNRFAAYLKTDLSVTRTNAITSFTMSFES